MSFPGTSVGPSSVVINLEKNEEDTMSDSSLSLPSPSMIFRPETDKDFYKKKKTTHAMEAPRKETEMPCSQTKTSEADERRQKPRTEINDCKCTRVIIININK